MAIHTLELFSGGKSFSKNHQHKNIAIDIDPKSKPDLCVDVANFNYREYPVGFFAIIWASPPCTEYSRAKTVGKRKLEQADKIVLMTLEIIEYLKPKCYYIENPHTGMLRHREFMAGRYFFVVDYCKYGYNYRKRTAIWTNNKEFKPRPLCKKDCPYTLNNYGKHVGGFGTRTTTCNRIAKYSVPSELILEILASQGELRSVPVPAVQSN